jgi:gamma-glutamyltranspeptidase
MGNYLCSELLAPNGDFLEENDILKRPLYADTLEMISWNGAGWFYDSDFMREMVEELSQDYDSILTEKDFKEYTAIERRAVESYYGGLSVRGVAAPSGGVVLGLILNILNSKGMLSGDIWLLSEMISDVKIENASCLCRVQIQV